MVAITVDRLDRGLEIAGRQFIDALGMGQRTYLHQLAVEMKHILAACSFMEIVDILGNDICIIPFFKLDKPEMAGVRVRLDEFATPRIIEIMDKLRIAAEAVGREVVLETVHIVCPHLADDDIDHEFGLGTCLGGSASGAQCAEQQDG